MGHCVPAGFLSLFFSDIFDDWDVFFVLKVKSFIETQRALLAEIQNGCKRNFILAKEKEETEQKMRQSASMAEIATEDGTTEEEEQPAAEESEGTEEKADETTGKEGQPSSQSGASAETVVPKMTLESDSDTEDEEEEVVTKSSSSTRLNQLAPQTQNHPLSASHTSSSTSASPNGRPSVISGITVTESTAPPGTPPSPGRCISVSSPGRGHKIFMVTRVESPPEQQLLQLQLSKPPASSQVKEASKKPADANTPSTQQTPLPPPSSQTQLTQEDVKESLHAPSVDCKLMEQSTVVPNTTPEPQSASQPTEDETASTLDPEVTDPSQQAPALPSESSSVQLTEEATESTESPKHEPTCVEGKKEEDDEVFREDEGQMMSPDSTVGECKELDELSHTQISIPMGEKPQQQPLTTALGQLQNELESASEEIESQKQTKEEEEEEGEALEEENEKPSLTEIEFSQPSQEEPCQTETDEQGAESVLSVQTDQQAPSVTRGGAQESNPPAEEGSKSPEPASAELEDSPDESSADEGECFAEAPEEVSSTLPNGLKPEFSRHLLDTEGPKPGSCVMEHGELQ